MHKIFRILDVDLDFFIKGNSRPRKTERGENTHKPWDEVDVKNFLLRNCGLTKGKKIPGNYFINHDELYAYCKKMRKSHGSTFVIDHVDAHADLGMCDFRVVNMFVDSERLKGSDWITDEKEAELDLNPGNFLLFFLSQHWLEELYYITNINYPHIDIPPNLISKTDSGIERLEMKYFENIDDISNPKLGTYIPGISSIPFQKIDYKTFNNCHQYDYMFLTQSPDYSPSESDALIDVIMQFIEITDPS